MANKITTAILLLVMIWFFSYLAASSFNSEGLTANVALIRINAPISSSQEYLFSNYLDSQSVVKLLERAEQLPNIKAVLLEINSPGGSAVSCEEIVKKVSSMNKTVVSWIRDIGTSGAYWIAASSDYIVASKASVVGSIGVYSSYLEFSGLLEKYGINYRRLVSGEFKDIGTPYRNMTTEEEELFKQRLRVLDEYFVEDVAEKRKLNNSVKKEISKAMFYLGEEALDLGLIDRIGGEKEALEYIKGVINETPKVFEMKKQKSFTERLASVFSKQSFLLGYGVGVGLSNNNFYKLNIVRVWS